MRAELGRWIANVSDAELSAELADMQAKADAGIEEPMVDAFFQDLSFGTAGLRGVIGAGTNRMNVYTVGRATQGFADYLNANFENPSVAIARDSRNKGELFVRTTAAILAANGVTAYVYPRISPVPTLSWAVRDLGCSGGICMTASHNPAPYNGYKAYGPDGCQITSEAAAAISAAIERTDAFSGVKSMDYRRSRGCRQKSAGFRRRRAGALLQRRAGAVGEQPERSSRLPPQPLKLVYTPLQRHGSCVPVTTVLARVGVSGRHAWCPSRSSPTATSPRARTRTRRFARRMQKGIDLCEQVQPDLLLATDPDCDRVGVACKDGDDCTRSDHGNEMGVLLLDYICRMRARARRDAWPTPSP